MQANNVKFNLNIFNSRLIHEDLSANDCFLTQRNKFEFLRISLYEYIIKLHSRQKFFNINHLSSIFFDAGLYLPLDYNI